jgi:basic amino acid/polyamine antiporter, APA family
MYAGLVIAVLTLLNAVGLKSGSRTQNLLTLMQVSGVVAIIIAGLLLASPPPVEPPSNGMVSTNWGLVLIFVMLAYGGWNEAAYVSAEALGPDRSLPRALFLSIAIITGLYLLMNLAYVKVLGLDGMAGSTAVAADMMGGVLGPYGAHIISTLVAIAALASVNATILMSARTTYAFGRNTPMFGWLGRWSPRRDAPVNALIAQAVIAMALVLLGAMTRQGFQTMVEYTAPVFWLFFLLTGVSLFVLRWRAPDRPRPFKVPLYPVTPLLFCAMCAYLLYASLRHTGIGALVGLAVLMVGVVVLLVSSKASLHHGMETAGALKKP